MYTVLVFEREFREVNPNAVAGMFIAANLAGVTDPLIMVRHTAAADATYHMISHLTPTGAFLTVECSPTNIIDTLRGNKNLKGTFTNALPNFVPLLMEYTVMGVRKDSTGRETATILTTFNDEAILQGIVAFLEAYNQYPPNILVLRNTASKQEWYTYMLPISITFNGMDTYVAPSKISVTANITQHHSPITLISSDPLGWKRNALLKALINGIGLSTTNTKVVGLTATNPSTYTVAISYTPTTHPCALGETGASAQPLTVL